MVKYMRMLVVGLYGMFAVVAICAVVFTVYISNNSFESTKHEVVIKLDVEEPVLISPIDMDEDEVEENDELEDEYNEFDFGVNLIKFKKDLPKADRKHRVGVQSTSEKIIVWSWKGGDTVKKEQLEQTVRVVLAKLPHVSNDPGVVSLIMETAAVESKRGRWMTQMKNGPARGMYQMEKFTIKDTLTWLKKYHNDVYCAVMAFYEKKQTEEWNYTYNVPWQTAMAATYYWRFVGVDLHTIAVSKHNRAMLYKLVWNTVKGKTTPEKWCKDTEEYA